MKKNLGKYLLVLLPLALAIYVLYPTYQAEQLKEKEDKALAEAKEIAAKNPEKGIQDSINRIDEFYDAYGEDLQNAKNNALKLGLDLRGGMYVTLEVDVIKLIEEAALKETIDETFLEVIEKTEQDLVESEEAAIDVFYANFEKIAKPKGKSLISYFDVIDFKDVSEEKIIERLEENANQAIDQAKEVIRQRIDKYGVSEPNIQVQGSRRILLELPGVTNETEMRKLLQTTARLEFKLLKNDQKIVRAFKKIDEFLAGKEEIIEEPADSAVVDTTSETGTEVDVAEADTSKKDTTAVAADTSKADTINDPYAGLGEKEAQEAYLKDHPFTSMFSTFFAQGPRQQLQNVGYQIANFPEGNYYFRILKKDISRFEDILRRANIKQFLPVDVQIAVGAKPINKQTGENPEFDVYEIYILKDEPEMTGEAITNATATLDPTTSRPVVNMSMDDEGSDRWAVITGNNVGEQIAIVLDERVYSAPVVQNRITGGSSQITGMANFEEANLLQIVLKAGALKAPVKIIEERVVGASLGEDSINSGLFASGIAFILVILYMFIYYSRGGLVADFAVMLNVLLVLAVLSALEGTLTLPGIAGIILTIGMAVDANILIFERIREELSNGRTLRSAIDEGFSKALSAIVDSNITTGITGIILYSFGSGPIQGFALTLIIGIFGTLFTGIMVSRAIIEISTSGGSTNFGFGQPKTANA